METIGAHTLRKFCEPSLSLLLFVLLVCFFKYGGRMGVLWLSWCYTQWQNILPNTTLRRNWSFSLCFLPFSEPSSFPIASGLPLLPLPIHRSHPAGLAPNLALSSCQRNSMRRPFRFFTMLLVYIFFWGFIFPQHFLEITGGKWLKFFNGKWVSRVCLFTMGSNFFFLPSSLFDLWMLVVSI